MAVALADIDNDEKLDIVVVNNGSSNVSVFKNNSTSGTVSFATRVNFATGTTGSAPNALAIADINGDGFQDIVVTNGGTNNISYLESTSTTTAISFAAKVNFTTGTMPVSYTHLDVYKRQISKCKAMLSIPFRISLIQISISLVLSKANYGIKYFY